MRQFTKRFQILLDDRSIDQKIIVEPPPLLDLGSLSVDRACLRLEKTLKEVFIPTPQIRKLLRLFVDIAMEHVQSSYLDEATFIKKCYERDLTRSPTWFSTGLCGLAGVGKSQLLKSLTRLLMDTGEEIAIPGLPVYPIQTIWTMTMRKGMSLIQLLQPFLAANNGSQETKNVEAVLIAAAKRAYTCGVALNVVDEFQFITSTQAAHAKAANVLMQLELLGPPLVFCANYSMINKLEKRPQQERQRLLAKVKFLYPDPSSSEAWGNSLKGQLNVAPELFSSDCALNAERDAEAIHRYSFGLKRLTSQLLNMGYRHARECRDGVVCLADIEWAYKSSDFMSQRKDVELLIQQNIEKKSAREDLWCDMAELQQDKVIEATAAIKEYESRVNYELAKSSMNKQDRDDYELLVGKNESLNGKKASIVPIRRGKLTKESLLDANKAFLDKYDGLNKK